MANFLSTSQRMADWRKKKLSDISDKCLVQLVIVTHLTSATEI